MIYDQIPSNTGCSPAPFLVKIGKLYQAQTPKSKGAILGCKNLSLLASQTWRFLDLGMVGLPPNSTPGCTWYWRNTWSSQVSFEQKKRGWMVENRWGVLESFQIKVPVNYRIWVSNFSTCLISLGCTSSLFHWNLWMVPCPHFWCLGWQGAKTIQGRHRNATVDASWVQKSDRGWDVAVGQLVICIWLSMNSKSLVAKLEMMCCDLVSWRVCIYTSQKQTDDLIVVGGIAPDFFDDTRRQSWKMAIFWWAWNGHPNIHVPLMSLEVFYGVEPYWSMESTELFSYPSTVSKMGWS